MSHLVCAKIRDVVVGRSTRIRSFWFMSGWGKERRGDKISQIRREFLLWNFWVCKPITVASTLAPLSMFQRQPEMKVFSGSANRELAEKICNFIGVPLGKATISSFPDGETYVRI